MIYILFIIEILLFLFVQADMLAMLNSLFDGSAIYVIVFIMVILALLPTIIHRITHQKKMSILMNLFLILVIIIFVEHIIFLIKAHIEWFSSYGFIELITIYIYPFIVCILFLYPRNFPRLINAIYIFLWIIWTLFANIYLILSYPPWLL
jgi:hypothetical protein